MTECVFFEIWISRWIISSSVVISADTFSIASLKRLCTEHIEPKLWDPFFIQN